MKIKSLTTHVLRKRLENPPRSARQTWAVKQVLLLRLETVDGTWGVGEAWVDNGAVEPVEAALLHEVAPKLIGRDVFHAERIFADIVEPAVVSARRGLLHAAASAVDIALWDIRGKLLGQPVYRLLGAASDRVFAYASGGLYQSGKTPADLGAEVHGWTTEGFEAVKIKIAGAPLAEDIARVAAVREAVGPDVEVMVDALYAYSAAEARAFARAAAPYDLTFFEAPVTTLDVDGLADLARVSPIPICGNECAVGRHEFARLISARAVDIVHVEAILCGGISEAVKIATLASVGHLPVSFHNSSSIVAFAANLHAAAAVNNAHSVEYHMVHRLLFDRVDTLPFEREGSHIVLSDRPGLGIDFDPAELQ